MARMIDVCLDCSQHKTIHGRGLCGPCYQRARRNKDLPPLTEATYDELLKRSRGSDPELCWTWKGSYSCEGAPIHGMPRKGREKYVARRVWLEANDRRSVSKGKVIAHACGNRACVNPAHLEQVDNGDNLRDLHAARKIAKGHFASSTR